MKTRAATRKRLLQGGVIGLGAAVALLALWFGGKLEDLEYPTWAWRVKLFAGRTPPSPLVKVILLDQASLDWGLRENGWKWGWPRTVYTAVIDFCKRGGAKAVAFDMLYTEPSSYSADDDRALGESIGRTLGFVGVLVLSRGTGQSTNWPADSAQLGVTADGLEGWLANHGSNLVMSSATFPVPEVATNATILANVTERPDPDGVFRRVTLFGVFDGKAVPSLGLGAYLAAEKAAGRKPAMRLEKGWLRIGEKQVPMDGNGRAVLRFKGKKGTHESFSAAAVIQSELRLKDGKEPVLEPAVFTNAFVFFGLSAPGLLEAHPTPSNHAYPGAEVHATALENLLTDSYLREVPTGPTVLATCLLGILSGASITLSRRARHSVAAFAVLLPVPIIAGFVAYPLGWWWPMVVSELTVAAALVGGLVFNYATEGWQKAFLRRAFKHYLGPEVIDQIIADPSRLKLGGEKRELTIFFSDIEKFSSFSEKLPSDTLTALLNEYLSDMSDIILAEGGYVDKYIGDAIVAFWNAPAFQPDHAVRAVRTVLRCQRMLAERSAHYQQKTGVLIKARIGLNTGEVTVGNMGSRDRFNYTVLGDAANLASRLEGANKVFGTYNLISEMTWQKTRGAFRGRELGHIRVVGRERPVRVYEIVGFAAESMPEFMADFEAGLKLSQAGRWQEALPYFERHPEDPPSVAYAAQCTTRLRIGSPSWDGIWNLTEK